MNVDYQIMTLRKIYKHWNGALELIASLQKENEELKNEKEPAGEFFMSKNGVVIKVIDNREEKESRWRK